MRILREQNFAISLFSKTRRGLFKCQNSRRYKTHSCVPTFFVASTCMIFRRRTCVHKWLARRHNTRRFQLFLPALFVLRYSNIFPLWHVLMNRRRRLSGNSGQRAADIVICDIALCCGWNIKMICENIFASLSAKSGHECDFSVTSKFMVRTNFWRACACLFSRVYPTSKYSTSIFLTQIHMMCETSQEFELSRESSYSLLSR